MKRFMILLLLTGLLLSGCMKSEPDTVATISPGAETVATTETAAFPIE